MRSTLHYPDVVQQFHSVGGFQTAVRRDPCIEQAGRLYGRLETCALPGR